MILARAQMMNGPDRAPGRRHPLDEPRRGWLSLAATPSHQSTETAARTKRGPRNDIVDAP